MRIHAMSSARSSLRLWSIVGLTAVGLFTTAALASAASPLNGTFRVTIAGGPPPLNGKWQLKFLPAGAINIVRNGKVVVIGRDVVTGSRFKISDRSGSYACSPAQATGLYTYKATNNRLTFQAVSDKCVGRKLILTSKPFLR